MNDIAVAVEQLASTIQDQPRITCGSAGAANGLAEPDIDTYTISQAVEDNATVPIYYEARLAKIALPDEKKPKVDTDFDEVTEGEEESVKGRLKSRWAKLEAMVGTEERLALIAADIVDHFERRTEILDGKAMIVAMSRRIAVDLYAAIVKLRPEWDADKDEDGGIKVVMTGSASDPPHWQQHIRNKPRLKDIEKRFKDAADPLKLVIVRDMWLTGFDAPCAHTLYVDKPMKGHGLMQAIARVNRVFKDKPSGLVVDYLGLAEQLRKAIGTYGGGKGERPGIPVEVALGVLVEMKNGLLARDPSKGLEVEGFVERGKICLTRVEARRLDLHLWEVVEQGRAEDREKALAILLLLYTGLREGELLRLQARDIDFEATPPVVQVERVGKTRSALRDFEVPSILATALRARVGGKSLNEWVWPSTRSRSGHRGKNWILVAVKNACAAADVAVTCPQGLRASHARLSREAGVTAHVIATQLGHTDTGVTIGSYVGEDADERAKGRRAFEVIRGGRSGRGESL